MLAETSMNALSAGIGAGVAVAVTIVPRMFPYFRNGKKSTETRLAVTEATLDAIQRELGAGFGRVENRLGKIEDNVKDLLRR